MNFEQFVEEKLGVTRLSAIYKYLQLDRKQPVDDTIASQIRTLHAEMKRLRTNSANKAAASLQVKQTPPSNNAASTPAEVDFSLDGLQASSDAELQLLQSEAIEGARLADRCDDAFMWGFNARRRANRQRRIAEMVSTVEVERSAKPRMLDGVALMVRAIAADDDIPALPLSPLPLPEGSI